MVEYAYVNKKDLLEAFWYEFTYLDTVDMRRPYNHDHLFRFFRRSPALFALSALFVSIALASALWHWPTWGVSSALAHHTSEQKIRGSLITLAHQDGTAPTSLHIDALSPQLAAYLSPFGSQVGVEVYDLTRQRSYSSNNTAQFLTASSIKVPIMLATFALTESQGREPNSNEMALLTAMIEHSDNDAASALFTEIGGAAGMTSFLQQTGISGLSPNDGAWGYSLITPQAMVDLLTQLHNGTILTATDRAAALDLMQHVEADQQWGVGDTAPSGATFAMKNGWVPGPDGLWSVNTSGIVNVNGETYIISVYTQEQSALANGQAIVQQVCGAVATALI